MYIAFTVGISIAKGISAITEAEVALKEVREKRLGSYYIYDDRLNNLVLQQESVYWINKIRDSIIDEDILVHYQPIMNNTKNEIEKYECLSRINDDGCLVSPYSFMEAAIATNVLYLMTQNVIREACKTFSKTDYEFSINITKDDYIVNYIVKYSKKYNINPSRIALEILEDITSLNNVHILEQLDALRDLGFKIAIDDFGAEHSNFSRLLEIQPDYLKIDGAFIKNIVTDKNSRIITESIYYICKQSGIKVIAEYIHNKEVLDAVQKIGIEFSQGFYIGKPESMLLPTKEVVFSG